MFDPSINDSEYGQPEKLDFLTIETTTLCNLSCRGCQRTKLVSEKKWKNIHMSVDVFKKIVGNLPEVAAATLHGIGEPTLNPDIVEIARVAKASGKIGQVLIFSNGQNKKMDVFKSLKEVGLDKVIMSIDSLDEKTADICRKGTNVDLLYKTIDAIKEAGLGFETSTVVSKYNRHEIIETIGAIDHFCPDAMNIQSFLDLGDPAGCLSAEEKSIVLQEIEEVATNDLSRPVRTFGFDLSNAPETCLSPWKEPAITVEGFLTPCCFTFDPSIFGFSQLSAHSYSDIWKSKPVQDFLHTYMAGCPTFCRGCYTNKREISENAPPKVTRFFVKYD